MRGIGLSLGSFALGALFTFLLGNHSTLLRPVLAQNSVLAEREGAPPVVPVVDLLAVSDLTVTPGKVLKLDGLDCRNCNLDGGTIVYSGGSFKFSGAAARTDIELAGPAKNTAILLTTFGLIGCPTVWPEQNKAPNRQTATFPKGTRLDFSSASGNAPR